MPTELQHDGPSKFALAGLDLNVPVDLVPVTKYSIATNVVSKIEGQLQARDGMTSIATILLGSVIHTIFRLEQPNPSVIGERLVGVSSGLFSAPLPAGNSFSQLTGGPMFNGSPLSIIQFRFDSDPAVWAIIANAAGMMKRRSGYYQVLGVAPPTVQAVATADGAGFLNSLTGTPYDWRYTYLNPITQSESNGSPVMAAVDTSRPTSNETPDSGQGGNAFNNPTLAYDNNMATSASGITGAGQSASMRVFGWAAAPHTYSQLVLYVNFTATIATTPGASAFIQYSVDSGITWTNIIQTGHTTANQTLSINLQPAQDLTRLQVRWHVGGTSNPNILNVFEVWTVGTISPTVPLTLALNNQSADICVAPPLDTQETAIRLYRRGGTLPNNWFQVGEYPVASLSQGTCGPGLLHINDNTPDSTAQVNPILPQDNFQPIQSVQAVNFPLPIVFGPSDGRVLACGDPARPDSVYFSNKGNADIWPAENWVVVANPGEEIMNGINYSLRTFAFSRERMYIMLPNIISGVTFTPSETSCRRGLKGRFALCAGEQGIYFIAKDGAYRTQGGPEQSIIDDSIRPLFPTREAPQGTPTNGYDAINLDDEDHLRMTYHNGEVWFYYQGLTTHTEQLLIYDERRSRWRAGNYTPLINMAYSEPNTDSSLLYGGTNGTLYAAGGSNDDGQTIPVVVQTGAMDQGRPLNLKEYLTVNFDVDPGGTDMLNPVVITPLINGNTLTEASLEISGTGRQRFTLPLNQNGLEVYAYNMAFDIAWAASPTVNPIFYQYETLYRWEPAEVTHWELPQVGLGMDGWFHIRDIYVVLRSNADVTLTVIPGSGAVQTFTLPNTNGAKNTVYVQLAQSKANSYGFALDSTATFRVYAEDCEVRVKQWLTNLGYKNVPILSREQVGKPFGLTNV